MLIFIQSNKYQSYSYKNSDNGKTAIDEKEFMKEDSSGLKIIHMMVEQMDTKLDVSVENRLGFEISA